MGKICLDCKGRVDKEEKVKDKSASEEKRNKLIIQKIKVKVEHIFEGYFT